MPRLLSAPAIAPPEIAPSPRDCLNYSGEIGRAAVPWAIRTARAFAKSLQVPAMSVFRELSYTSFLREGIVKMDRLRAARTAVSRIFHVPPSGRRKCLKGLCLTAVPPDMKFGILKWSALYRG